MPTPLPLAIALDMFASTLDQLKAQVADIPDARLAEQPAGLVNHPAWTLTHLCSAAGFVLALLDEPDPATANESKLAGPGTTPSPARAAYASKAALLDRLADLHARVHRAVLARHETHFPRASPEHLRRFAPTLGRIVMYLITAHEPYHQGQLAQWRRAAGLKPA